MPDRKPEKRFAWQPRNRFLYGLMSSRVGVIVINWMFQGVLGMDRSEKAFKIVLDVLLTGGLAIAFSGILAGPTAVLLAFVTAHTLNWLFNGHLFVVGRFAGFTKIAPGDMWRYVEGIRERSQEKSFLCGVVIFGALSRGKKVRTTSDLDIRFIRNQNFWDGLLANCYALYERSRALLARFPLDLYVYDDLSSLDRLRQDEIPIIVCDPVGALKEKYGEQGFTILHGAQRMRNSTPPSSVAKDEAPKNI